MSSSDACGAMAGRVASVVSVMLTVFPPGFGLSWLNVTRVTPSPVLGFDLIHLNRTEQPQLLRDAAKEVARVVLGVVVQKVLLGTLDCLALGLEGAEGR